MPRPTALVSLLAALLALTAPVPAQISSTAGPAIAPVGCSIQINIENASTAPFSTGVCPYVVRDTNGRAIFSPVCILILVTINPGGVFNTSWPQIDDFNNPVPPGTYFVDVTLPSGTVQTHTITIGGVTTGLTTIGPARIGTTRRVALCAPQQPSNLYFLGYAASSSTGIPTCAGTLPLDNDAVFNFALQPGNGVFNGNFGVLDPLGETQQPTISLPNLPGLAGNTFQAAFLTIDPAQAPCPVTDISGATTLTIV